MGNRAIDHSITQLPDYSMDYVVRVAPWPRMARFTRFRISGIL
jgi:hypothetical protein